MQKSTFSQRSWRNGPEPEWQTVAELSVSIEECQRLYKEQEHPRGKQMIWRSGQRGDCRLFVAKADTLK